MIFKACAYSPANISCVFKIYEHKNPRWMGSTGVGFTLNKGVTVEATKAKTTEVFFNYKKIVFPTVRKVINYLTHKNVKINVRSPLPLGCGFGLSGAAALATAYALNKLFGLGKSRKQLAITAHTAEVECKTGLGDVVNEEHLFAADGRGQFSGDARFSPRLDIRVALNGNRGDGQSQEIRQEMAEGEPAARYCDNLIMVCLTREDPRCNFLREGVVLLPRDREVLGHHTPLSHISSSLVMDQIGMSFWTVLK